MSAEALLIARGLRKSFGGVLAVDSVSLSVRGGELVALIGPNGAGKSTCFDMLGGQLRPDAGTVTVMGRPVSGWSARAICRLGVGHTFQVTETFASMTVRENVQTALTAHARRTWRFWRPASRFEAPAADRLLEQVGLAAQAERAAGVLAYGDLKRLDLAMALAGDPRLLLMDEPTAGMAAGERGALMALAREAARGRGLAVLFTEHDMDVVFGLADRILVLDRGALIAEGPPDSVRRDKRVQAVYLGC